jgi:hypothetical protein
MIKAPPKSPAPTQQPAATQAAPPSSIDYYSGYQANGQGVNSGQAKANFGKRAKAKNTATTQDGQRGVQDLQNGMTANFQSQMARQLESNNSEKFAQDQANRSQLMQQGLANQSKIYSDIQKRSIDQMGLATKLQEAQIRNNFAKAQQQALKIKTNLAKAGGSLSAGSAFGSAETLIGRSLLQ